MSDTHYHLYFRFYCQICSNATSILFLFYFLHRVYESDYMCMSLQLIIFLESLIGVHLLCFQNRSGLAHNIYSRKCCLSQDKIQIFILIYNGIYPSFSFLVGVMSCSFKMLISFLFLVQFIGSP